jgi:hypothetical protein
VQLQLVRSSDEISHDDGYCSRGDDRRGTLLAAQLRSVATDREIRVGADSVRS